MREGSQISLADFDVAMQPGLRSRLAEVYQEFRAVQSGSQVSLNDRTLVTSRSSCPSCGKSVDMATLLFIKNAVPHVRCQQCQLVYTKTILDEVADAAQYDDNAFMRAYVVLKRHPVYAKLEIDKARYFLQRALAHKSSLRNVLDVGASTGAVMKAAIGLMSGYGIEPDSAMAVELSKEYGDKFVNGYFPQDLPTHWPQFDLISLLDVLEHIVEPLKFLTSLRASLSPNGLLLIQVPNFNSLLVQLQGVENSNFCIGHWQHFTVSTLTSLMQRAGFRTVETANCITELDRIREFPEDQIKAAVKRILGSEISVDTSERLYELGLGYKLYGLFSIDT